MRLLLASASPARRQTLISAGITPLVAVSKVPEDELLAQLFAREENPSPATQVQLLATAKAHDIADQFMHSHEEPADTNYDLPSCNSHEQTSSRAGLEGSDSLQVIPRVVVGCDSMFAFDGEVVGKPHTPEVSRERLLRMSGKYGDLFTGHCVIDTLTGQESTGVSCARVYIAKMSNSEIDAYIESGEPLVVAGSFTIDGFGGPFVERIEGDHHGVVGISLPLLRRLLLELDHSIIDFWDIRQD